MRIDKPRIVDETIFRDLPVLETDRLILRKLSMDDAADIYSYASDPEMSRYTVWSSHTSIEDARCYLHYVLENYEKGLADNWGIVYKSSGRLIGTIGFFAVDREDFRAEIHYAISRAYSGKGLMSEAVRKVLSFGFGKLQLNRIQAHCMIANIGSERVMQKAGMTFEGIERESIFVKGEFHDLKRYAILQKDFSRTT